MQMRENGTLRRVILELIGATRVAFCTFSVAAAKPGVVLWTSEASTKEPDCFGSAFFWSFSFMSYAIWIKCYKQPFLNQKGYIVMVTCHFVFVFLLRLRKKNVCFSRLIVFFLVMVEQHQWPSVRARSRSHGRCPSAPRERGDRAEEERRRGLGLSDSSPQSGLKAFGADLRLMQTESCLQWLRRRHLVQVTLTFNSKEVDFLL